MHQLTQEQISIINLQQPRLFNLESHWHLQKQITPMLVITGKGKTMEEAARRFATQLTDHFTTKEYDHPFDDDTMD